MSLKPNYQIRNTLHTHVPIITNTPNSYITPYPSQYTHTRRPNISNPLNPSHLSHTSQTSKTQQSHTSIYTDEGCEEDFDLPQSFPQTWTTKSNTQTGVSSSPTLLQLSKPTKQNPFGSEGKPSAHISASQNTDTLNKCDVDYALLKNILYDELLEYNDNMSDIPKIFTCEKCHEMKIYSVAPSDAKTQNAPPKFCPQGCNAHKPKLTLFENAALSIDECLSSFVRMGRFNESSLQIPLQKLNELRQECLPTRQKTIKDECIVTASDARMEINRQTYDPLHSCMGKFVASFHANGCNMYSKATGTLISVRKEGNECCILVAGHSIRAVLYQCTVCQKFTLDSNKKCKDERCPSHFTAVKIVEPHRWRFVIPSLNGDIVGEYIFEWRDTDIFCDPRLKKLHTSTTGIDYAFLKVQNDRLANYGKDKTEIIELKEWKALYLEQITHKFSIHGFAADHGGKLVGMSSPLDCPSMQFVSYESDGENIVYMRHKDVDTGKEQSGSCLWTDYKIGNRDKRVIFGVHEGGENDYNKATVFNEKTLPELIAFLGKRFEKKTVINSVNKFKIRKVRNLFRKPLSKENILNMASLSNNSNAAQSYNNDTTNTHSSVHNQSQNRVSNTASNNVLNNTVTTPYQQQQTYRSKRKIYAINGSDATLQNPNKRLKLNQFGNNNGRPLNTNIAINEYTNTSLNNGYDNGGMNSYAFDFDNQTHAQWSNVEQNRNNNTLPFHHTHPHSQTQPIQYGQQFIQPNHTQSNQQNSLSFQHTYQQPYTQPSPQTYPRTNAYPTTQPQYHHYPTLPYPYNNNNAWQQNSGINGVDMYGINGSSESFYIDPSMSPNTPPMPAQNIMSVTDNTQQWSSQWESNILFETPKPKKKEYPCPSCDKVLRSKGGLCNHKNDKHSGVASWPCDQCNLVYESERSRKRHQKRAHN